jgi:hypothetical protein
MKKFTVILLCCFSVMGAPPPGGSGSGAARGIRSVYVFPVSVSYLIQQDFEGAGYDNGETWNDLGTTIVDPDDATHPAVGSQELELTKNSGTTPSVVSPTFAATAVFDFFFSLYISDVATQNPLVVFRSTALEPATIYMRTTGRLAIYDDGSGLFSVSPADSLSANTQYFVWAHLDFTSGDATLAFSTTQVKPTSGTKFASGSAVMSVPKTINNLVLGTSVNPSSVFMDKIRVSTATIGSSPP